MSALRLLREVEVVSGVTNLNVTDVFSADYDIYKIQTTGLSTTVASSEAYDLRFINASGSIMDNTAYDYGFEIMKAETSFSVGQSTSGNDIDNFFALAKDGGFTGGQTGYVFDPFNPNTYTFVINQLAHTVSANMRSYKQIGVLHELISITGFSLKGESDGALDAGIIRVYGLHVEDS